MLLKNIFSLQVFPLLYALMEKKTKIAYKGVFEYLKSKFPNFTPKKLYCDYEISLMRSAEEVFNTNPIRIVGCLFHFTQVIIVIELIINFILYNFIHGFLLCHF